MGLVSESVSDALLLVRSMSVIPDGAVTVAVLVKSPTAALEVSIFAV